MLKTPIRTTGILAAVLAGALALPGLAAAQGDRDWRDDRRGDWRDDRYGYPSDRRWAEPAPRHPRHSQRHWHRVRPDVAIVERPVHPRRYTPAPRQPRWGRSYGLAPGPYR